MLEIQILCRDGNKLSGDLEKLKDDLELTQDITRIEKSKLSTNVIHFLLAIRASREDNSKHITMTA
ncbi:hypothetical protein LTR66_016520, partial [Elasticomyces elasticus]